MNTLVPLLFVVATAILAAGCVNPFEPALILPTTTSEPATAPVPAVTPPGTIPAGEAPPDLNPGPTSIIPPLYGISIQVQKNPVPTNPWISVVYEGSPGQVLPALVEAMVVRSDGVTERKSARNPPRGTQLLFNGTTAADRVIVNVTYQDGSVFTIQDALVPMRNRAQGGI